MNAPRRTAAAVAFVAAVAVLAAGCSGSSSKSTSAPPSRAANTGSSAPSTSATGGSGTKTPAATGNIYLSLGDSYAAGYQPTGRDSGHTTAHGFAYQVVGEAKARGYELKLVNFGCAGATTSSVLHDPGCERRFLGPGATPYRQTQAGAAETYLRAHRGQVRLITVSLGGNDITRCAAASDTVGCLTAALSTAKRNLTTLARGLRAAAGPATTIIGTTYPDVFLGRWLSRKPADIRLAKLSVVGFRGLINPALQGAYATAGGRFVDVTAATGAYQPLTKTITVRPFGRLPVAVAKVCRLTYFCQYEDIHPRTAGYALIARLVVGELPPK